MTYKQRTRVFETMGVLFDGESVESIVKAHRATIKEMAMEHKAQFKQDATPAWKLEIQMVQMFRSGLTQVDR